MPAGKDGNKGTREARAERLEAELRANLKRRKEQTRSRAKSAVDAPARPSDTAAPVRPDADDDEQRGPAW